jgi:hypothetical protein
MTLPRDTADDRAFAERYVELLDRLDNLWGELPNHFPTSPGWTRVSRDIDQATKDLRACASDWLVLLRGVAS